jgi:hypothetical protein
MTAPGGEEPRLSLTSQLIIFRKSSAFPKLGERVPGFDWSFLTKAPIKGQGHHEIERG